MVKSFSITTKLSLAIALLVTVSLGTLSLLAVMASRRSLGEQVQSANLTAATLTARAVEKYIADAASIMREAPGRPKLGRETRSANWPEVAAVLENFHRNFTQFDYVFVQDPQGVIRVRVPHADTVGQDFSFRDFFQEAMRTRRPYISGLYVSTAARRPVVSIAVPVLDEAGEVKGVVVGALSLRALTEFVSTIGRDGGLVYVVDAKGVLVAQAGGAKPVLPGTEVKDLPVVQAALAGRSGTMEFHEPGRGESFLGAYVPLPSLGWGVVAAQPVSAAYAAGYDLGRWLVWIALGFTAGAVVLGWVVARTLAGPLRRLAQATDKLGAGDFSVRVTREGHDEVAALATSFNTMAEQLQHSYQGLEQKNKEIATLNERLEQRVVERTQQFEAASDMAEALKTREAEVLAATEALRTSNQTLTAIVKTSPLAIWTLNRDGNVTSWNPAAERMFGWRENEVLGRPHPIIPEDKQEEFQRNLWRELQGETLLGIELRRQRKDHSPIDISLASAPLRDSEGNVVGAVSVTADITDRKRAEEEVRRVTRALRVLSQCNQILIRATAEQELLQGICRMIVGVGGYRFAWVGFAEHDEAKRIRPVGHAGHEEGYLALLDLTWADAERSGLPIGRAIQSGRPVVVRDMQTHPALAERRTEMARRGYASSVALPLVAAEQSLGVLVVYAEEPDGFDAEEVKLLAELADDLAFGIIALRTQAERARAEEELRQQREKLSQTEKLAAMGQLLAGVAHELNNPLAIVLGHTAMLKMKAEGSPVAARATKIADAAERSVRIVRNFLALARRRPPERQEVRLNQVVREAVELLAYPLRSDDVEVQFNLADDLPVLWADPHQLHQVVVNLVSNAHQAMREMSAPRRITCTTRYQAVQTRVALEVADTGPGIPPEVQARIFEPFFTTKPAGHGTGLGLSISQGIIEGHGGSMRVNGRPGEGATFVIELPVATPAGQESKVETAASRPLIRGKSILIVDDESEVASVLSEMLAVDGHEVAIASNGAIALDTLGKQHYDLIFSDIKMPELDGPGLYRQLEHRDPGAVRRFIFVTGDVLTPGTRAFLDSTHTPVLDKPFALDEVKAMTQRVLRGCDATDGDAPNGTEA